MRKFTLMMAAAALFGANVAFAQTEAPAYTLTPAPGAVTDLQGVVLSFTDEVVSVYEGNRMPVAVLENTTTGVVYTCAEPDFNAKAMDVACEYTFMFIEEGEEEALPNIAVPGDYTLTIKALYIEGEEGEDNVDLDPIVANYTITFPVSYTLTPAAGVAEDLQGISIAFDELVYFYENNRMPSVTLENLTTGTVYVCNEPDRNTNTQSTIEYTLTFVMEGEEEAEAAIIEPGEYVLTLKAMYTGTEEDPTDLPVLQANYVIEYPVSYSLDPVPGVVTELQGITLTFEETGVAFYENSRMPLAVLENLETGAEYTCEMPDRNTNTTAGTEYQIIFVDEDGEAYPTIATPGKYLLTIKGLYVGDYVDLPVITANYTIEYPVTYVLNPMEGVVTDLTTVSVDFGDNTVAFYENNRMPVATLVNTTTGVTYLCQEADRNTNAMTDGVEYSFTFLGEDAEEVEPITTPGNYTLTIMAMYYNPDATGEEGEEVDNVDLPVITAHYVIEYPYAYTLTPMAGSTVENLQGITLSFDEAMVSFYENSAMPLVRLENVATGALYTCADPDRNTRVMDAAVEYTFMFADENDEVNPITIPGDYVLTIAGMYVEEEGEDGMSVENVDLPVITANYTVAYPVFYLMDPANEAVVGSISKVTIEFASNEVAFYENNRMPVAVIANGQEGDDDVTTYNCNEADRNTFADTEGVVYDLYFVDEADEVVEISTPGLWYLTIRGLYKGEIEEATGEDGDVEQTQVDLPVINAVYYVTGEENPGSSKVVDLTAPDGVYNVYTIGGVQVVKNGSVESLKSLGKGIYVINGKKVVL